MYLLHISTRKTLEDVSTDVPFLHFATLHFAINEIQLIHLSLFICLFWSSATYQCVTGGRGDGAILALQQREEGVVRMGGDWAVLLSHPQPSRALLHHRPVKDTRWLTHHHLNTHTHPYYCKVVRNSLVPFVLFFLPGLLQNNFEEKDLLCVFLFCFP